MTDRKLIAVRQVPAIEMRSRVRSVKIGRPFNQRPHRRAIDWSTTVISRGLGTFANTPITMEIASFLSMYAIERVDRVMSAALSIDVEESAGAMLRMFVGYPIHHLPVVSGQKVVGMLSSADVMKLAAFLPKTGVAYNEFLNQPVSVAALMSKPVITIQPHQSLVDAADLMASHGIHALPVVDAQDRLLGIVTTTDIMHTALQRVPHAGVVSPTAGGVQPSDIKLTGAAFDQAIAAAKTAVGAGQDQQGIATALLYLQQRLILLERLLQIADRYLSCGQDQSLQVALRKAIGEAKRATPSGGVDTPPTLGLGSS